MEDIWLDSKFKEKKRNIKRRNNEKKKRSSAHREGTCDVNLLRCWWRSRKQQLQGKIKADKH